MHYKVKKLEDGNRKRREMESHLSALTITRKDERVRLEWCDLDACMLSVSFFMVCVTKSHLEGGEM
jgi:hypothetical protein